MESPYRRPDILRLYGVTLGDYKSVEDIADRRLLAGIADGAAAEDEPAPESIHPPDKIPRVFTGPEAWAPTNLCCWQCDRTFDTPPKFVPTYVREDEKGGIEIGVGSNGGAVYLLRRVGREWRLLSIVRSRGS